VKQLTGGDVIAARYLYQEFFEFRPQFKLFMGVNHTPVIQGTDHGIWRRLYVVRFAVTIPEAERDKALMQKLRAELPGVLHWAMEGCLAWQAEGLEPPKAVAEATEEYRAEMDVLARFLLECCDLSPEAQVATALLYARYVRWCGLAGEAPVQKRAFASTRRERGFQPGRSRHEHFWQGLTLREES
jgi:putative DNA primase/helicase